MCFCREPTAKSKEEADKNRMNRIKKKNDPAAIREMGKKHYHEGDYDGALKYLTTAAVLGDSEAYFNLSLMYRDGKGAEKDIEKAIYHAEEAAIGGHPMARHYLGLREYENGRYERAKKHLIIAANFGDDGSLKILRQLYANGYASKEDYAGALRAYQAAVDATKSTERKEAEEALKSGIARTIC